MMFVACVAVNNLTLSVLIRNIVGTRDFNVYKIDDNDDDNDITNNTTTIIKLQNNTFNIQIVN